MPSSIATLPRPPLIYREEADFLFVDLSVFQVRFYRGTRGYDEVLKDGRQIVADVRWVLRDSKGKQVGTPQRIEWEVVDPFTLRVRRFYTDFLGTEFWVVQECRSDDRIKISVEGVIGKPDTFSLVWSASGITSPSVTHERGLRKVSCFELDVLTPDVAFDYSDVYEQLGDVTTFEVSGMAGGRKADFAFGIGGFSAGQEFRIDPSTVGATSTKYAVNNSQERRMFYASGRFWVFYGDGTNLVYRTSTDGSTWSAPTVLLVGVTSIKIASSPVWFDGTYLHYTRLESSTIYYRRGKPEADGTITWSAAEQTVSTNSAGVQGLCVDSQGYPWIGDIKVSPYMGRIIKSSKNDGTWETAAGFPYTIRSELSYPFVVPLTGGKVYALSSVAAGVIYGRLWNGSSWEAQEAATISLCEFHWSKSAVSDDDDVHLVFLKDVNDHILYVKRTYGVGWGAEETVQASATITSFPVLSIDGDGTLYCFWSASPTANHVYYKKCVAGAWDADPTDWIDETVAHLYGNDYITCYYKAYGGYIALAYLTGTLEAALNVRHEYLYFPPPPILRPRRPKIVFMPTLKIG